MLEPVVFIVDDDCAVRDSLGFLIRTIGLQVEAYSRPQEFLAGYRPGQIGCLLLDIRMPGVSGLSFQEELGRLGIDIPIIFITGHGDVAQCSRAFRAGAADFLAKPLDETALIESIQRAIAANIAHQATRASVDESKAKLTLLTAREHEVFRMIVDGHPNKVIARALELGVRTVESHRARIFEKLEVNSLAEGIKLFLAAAR